MRKGVKHSEATKQKMRDASKKRWAKAEEHEKVRGANSHHWGGEEIVQRRRVLHDGVYIREHRAVMSIKLGRNLSTKEVVHHIDNDRHNNHPDNLWLFPDTEHHSRFHVKVRTDKCYHSTRYM